MTDSADTATVASPIRPGIAGPLPPETKVGLPIAAPVSTVDLADLLRIDRIDRHLYRSVVTLDEALPLYGGQVAAQALLAAGRTVPEGRLPHSLHCYYLRGGDSGRPVVFRVDEDRDGRSYSARRVTAVQAGEIIFTLSASFVVPRDGADYEAEPISGVPDPEDLPEWKLERLSSLEARVPPQRTPSSPWPTRFWARSAAALPDSPLVHAAALTYLSDLSTGLADAPGGAAWTGASLDHAVWFHRPVRLDEWVLVDLLVQRAAAGRGVYTGTIRSADGTTAATLIQEAMFREPLPGRAVPRI